jgi:nucleoside-diphosphate-sugar epimerase
MRVLVAGGKGFIGSNLCKSLDSHKVFYEPIDLKDGVDICNIQGSDYKVVVLLAAQLDHSDEMYEHNLRIYQWAMKQNAHIIYTSSAAVYADSKTVHIETDPTPAPTIYGRSKLMGEDVIKASHDSWTVFRLANVFGNGDGNGVIDIFKRGGKNIYGDGNDIRDYISVETVCEAIVKVILNPSGYNKQTYNISSGVPLSTNAAFDLFGKGIANYMPARDFDVAYSVLDNSKAVSAGLI